MDERLMELRYKRRPDLPVDQRATTGDYPMFDTFIAALGIGTAEAWQDRETGEAILFHPTTWNIRQSIRVYGRSNATERGRR